MCKKRNKRLAPTMLAWFFAIIGMLAAGVNLQAAVLDIGEHANKVDSSQVFVFSSGGGLALLPERDDKDHSLDAPTVNAFASIKCHWQFIGFLKTAGSWLPALRAALHLRPPLRAPPLK
ncbi:MAG: hypothetical protein ACJA1I_002115 [Zhongshania marina]|jgi:hypothetical protein